MFHIKSTTPAIITIDKDFLLENFTHKIDIDKQNMIIKYYPLDKYIDGKITLPYVKNIDLTSLKNCKEYDVIIYPNNHIEIILKPFLLTPSSAYSKTSHKLENSKKKLEIYNSHISTLSLQNEDNYVFFDYKSPVKFVKGIEIDNVCHIILKNDNYIYIQIYTNQISIFDDIKTSTFDQNKFSAIIPNFDMAKSGKAIEINFSKPYTFSQKDIYINSKPTITTNDKLIPYAFLESVRSKNYKLARHYVSNPLQKKLADNVFDGYFGKIHSICHDIYNDSICIISQEKDRFVAKDYSFVIQTGKICDINEV